MGKGKPPFQFSAEEHVQISSKDDQKTYCGRIDLLVLLDKGVLVGRESRSHPGFADFETNWPIDSGVVVRSLNRAQSIAIIANLLYNKH